MNSSSELSDYFQVERQRIEYWRTSRPLKSQREWESVFQPRPFVPDLAIPVPPSRYEIERETSQRLRQQVSRALPHNTSLHVVTAGGSVVVGTLGFILLLQMHHPIIALFLAAVAAMVVLAFGEGFIYFIRCNDINSRVEHALPTAVQQAWESAQSQFQKSQADHESSLASAQRQWNEQEAVRVKAAKMKATDRLAIKSVVDEILSNQPHLELSFQVFADRRLSVVLRVHSLGMVINAKTKTISAKTSKVINKSKPREQREQEYEFLLAGLTLAMVVCLLNISPYCESIQIALYSDGTSRKVYHVAGAVSRHQVPSFSWRTVDPVVLLRQLGFRIEPTNLKANTPIPDWVDGLERVQINIDKSSS